MFVASNDAVAERFFRTRPLPANGPGPPLGKAVASRARSKILASGHVEQGGHQTSDLSYTWDFKMVIGP